MTAPTCSQLAAHVDELVAEGGAPLTDRLGAGRVRRRAAGFCRAAAGASTSWCRMPCRASRGPTGWSARRTSSWPGIRGCASCDRPGGWPVVRWPGGRWRRCSAPGGSCCYRSSVPRCRCGLGLVLRRREPLGTEGSAALGVGNALAVVLLLPMLAFYTSAVRRATPTRPRSSSRWRPGLAANGSPVTNVYAYDAAGHRLDDVRLFDQFGQPLAVSPDVVPVPTGPDGQELVAWPPDQRALSVFPTAARARGRPVGRATGWAGPRPWWWCRSPAPPSRAPLRPRRRPRARARRPLPRRVRPPRPTPTPSPSP